MGKRIKNKNHVHIKDFNFSSFGERRKGNWRSFVLFFLVLDDERDILLAEHSRTTAFSTNQSENQNQTRRACTRLLTPTDSANEFKSYTLYLLNSLSSSGDTLVVCLQCLKKCSC